MSNHQLIPLNRLIVSRPNVRRTDRKAEIDALASSITAHGLLQNLTVSPTETDKFEVIAGGRRLAALKSLAKSGAIARDFAVPCQIIESDGASEVSLAENVQRVAMDAMDEVEAFSALADAGQSVEDIARRFGIGARHVEQRLALAALSPKIKAAYRRGDVTLDAARAFCLVDDHPKQEAVFKSLSKPITHPGSVRSQLMQGRMRHTDRLARFVGLEAYEAAGGTLKRDLFETDGIYVDDPALINKLAHDRLDAVRDDALSQGWAWVEVNINQHRFESAYGARLRPTQRAMTEEARLADLRAAGVTAATMTRMANDGEVVRLARGLYQLAGAELDAQHSVAEAATRVPKGVICLTSALAFHGLTDQLPRKVWIAIGVSDWAPEPSSPPLRIVRMTGALLGDSVETHTIEGVNVKVFGVAKTVADCFRHRRSVGLSVALEGLQETLRQRKVTPGAMSRQASKSGVATVMRPYLEALTANA